MFKKLKRFLIGRPLKNEALEGEKFGVLWGLPILSSDAISSVAYAGQEIMFVLFPIGLLAFRQLTYISAAIIALLIILTLSYRQTIEKYPNGGGAFIVAKENIGPVAGVIAGSALSIGYIMTVAVSIASGVDQVVSAFKELEPYRVLLCVGVILLMTIGNLRGIKESAKLFSLPTYFFIISVLIMVVVGFIRIANGYVPTPVEGLPKVAEPLTLYLILKAFTNGCAALTGVEAVSNAVPNFKEPSVKNAKSVLVLLSTLVFLVFGSTSVLANFYKTNPDNGALLIQMCRMIFGGNHIFFYIFTALSFIILALAANTAYFGFPNLISVMAKEGYVPRQLSMRGDRLSYSNGIILLTSISILLIVVFQANVTSLIGLYAIGVFISFTLSQSGMFLRWYREKEKNWGFKAAINGFGALVTFTVVIIIAITKFNQGTWIVLIVIPILIVFMFKVKRHYVAVSKQLVIKVEELKEINIENDRYRNQVIVPIAGINKSSIRALRYAKTISDNVVAFSVSIDEESANKIKERFAMLNTDIPLIIKYSPFRKVVEPLLKFIESTEYDYNRGDMITVVLPQFSVKSWWHNVLHNQTIIFVRRELLKHKHIVVAIMPLQLKDDDYVLKNPKFKDR